MDFNVLYCTVELHRHLETRLISITQGGTVARDGRKVVRGSGGDACNSSHEINSWLTRRTSVALLGHNAPERRARVRLMIQIARLNADIACSVELDSIVHRV